MTTPNTPVLPLASGAEVRAVVGALVRHHRLRTLGVCALFLLASGLGLVLPASLGKIVDAVATGAEFPIIAAWVGAVAAGGLGAALVGLWGARILAALVQDILASLREEVFSAAMRLPVSTVDDGESADLLSRVTGDVDAVAEAGGNVVPVMLAAGFAIAVSVAALFALNPWLALAGLACVPFYILGTRTFLRRSRVVFREVRAREADRSQAVLEAVAGMDTLTALGEQDWALERVRGRAEASIQMQIEGARIRNRLFRWINGGEVAGLVAILAVGFLLHANAAITVGMVTTAALVFHRLFDPIGQLIFALDDLQRATIGLSRLVGVICLAETVAPAAALAPDTPRTAATGITLENVSFSYPRTGRGVEQVSLRVEPGTTAALVGTSGSGKSTLARLIAGHYPPSSGTLSLDAPGITPYYISQEIHQFRGGIAQNLRLVAPEATDDQLRRVLSAVGAEWALDAVPAPIAGTRSGEPLDEGRIQQLALARALLADPAVVILDEATADVGLHHRDRVEAAITALRADRTTILIAHRLEQAATAEEIFVCEGGAIIQRGSHPELLAVDGAYRTFWAAHGDSELSAAPRHVLSPSHPHAESETP